MTYYMTYGEFQEHLKAYYDRTNNRLQFVEMTAYLYKKGKLYDQITPPDLDIDYDNMTDTEFEKVIDSLPLSLNLYDGAPLAPTVQEADMIPTVRDVFVIRHPRYTRFSLHTHTYFEINYVAHGQGRFVFEEEEHIMHEGELCIIAPNSKHDFLIDDDSTVFTICIRKSTFDTTFFSIMTKNDLLSYFFRTILQGDNHANYLMFFTDKNEKLKRYIRNMIIESNKKDAYSNTCCISYTYLMFSTLLRDYSQTIQFYNYQMGTDFSLVLQYIQHNYQTLSLSSLAELFHYSEPHLCTLIKQNTGLNFTELIKRLRLSDAMDYLLNTNIKISEIADRIGYNSADHFSRVFRSVYKISPQEYRKHHKNTEPVFAPFVTRP